MSLCNAFVQCTDRVPSFVDAPGDSRVPHIRNPLLVGWITKVHGIHAVTQRTSDLNANLQVRPNQCMIGEGKPRQNGGGAIPWDAT